LANRAWQASHYAAAFALVISSAPPIDAEQSNRPLRVTGISTEQPLIFEPNVGQADGSVSFVARTATMTFLLTPSEILIAFPDGDSDTAVSGRSRALRSGLAGVRMKLKGARAAEPVAVEPLASRTNYLLGNDPSRWLRGVPNYAKVIYPEMLPGVDLVFHGKHDRPEYDFVLAPGTDPRSVEIEFEGASGMSLNPEGDLVVESGGARIIHRRPRLHQDLDGRKKEVAGRFAQRAKNRVGFEAGDYDTKKRLTIDPLIEFEYSIQTGGVTSAFFFGAARNDPSDVAVDPVTGNVYLCGFTTASDFPTTEDAFKPAGPLRTNGFVVRVSPAGDIFGATYIGGSRADNANAIAVDAEGNAYVAGYASSTDFPTVNGFQPVKTLGFGSTYAFLAKLDANLSNLLYSTYIGGTELAPGFPGEDASGTSVAAGASGIVAVSGYTGASNFPTTGGAWKSSSVAFDYDIFVMKLDTTQAGGASLLASTRLGGSDSEDFGTIAMDAAGSVYAGGSSSSSDISRPGVPGADPGPPSGFSAFVGKFNPSLTNLEYFTLIGGRETVGILVNDQQQAIAVGHPSFFKRLSADGTQFLAAQSLGTENLFADLTRSPDGRIFAVYVNSVFDPVLARLINTPKLVELDESGSVLADATLAIAGTAVAAWKDGQVYVARSARPGGAGTTSFAQLAKFQAPAQERIDILPSTTRWKPQRDATTPITVNFKGPSDLDATTVRLEVMPPAGFFGTYTPTKGGVTKVTGTEDQYTFDWTGPWTYTDSSGDPRTMPRGNYGLTVFGKRSSSDTEIRNETPFDKVSLVEVTSVRLQAVASALDGNPGPGGGQRIFPEADVPAPLDDVGEKDQVAIVATLDPVIPAAELTASVRVYFRAIDVDDPSANTPPVDDETRTNDNCQNPAVGPPNPNCVSGPNGVLFDPASPGSAADGAVGIAVSTTTDTATARLVVSMAQGDNYRVTASTSDAWLRGISAKQDSPGGEVLHASTEPLVEGTHFTQMLTLWRTLHLELDHLDSSSVRQVGPSASGDIVLDLVGRITSLSPLRLQDASAPFLSLPVTGSTPLEHSALGSWTFADLWPRFDGTPQVTPCFLKQAHGGDCFKVSDSGADFLEVGKHPAITGPIDLTLAAAVGDAYRLSDDRHIELDGSLPVGLLAIRLGEAFIALDANPPGNRVKRRAFERNMEPGELRLYEPEIPSSHAYWSVLLFDAYDAPVANDNDPFDPDFPTPPRSEEVARGMTVRGSTTRHAIAAVFRETIRDRSEPGLPDFDRTVAHEVICHCMENLGRHQTLEEWAASLTTLCDVFDRFRWDALSAEQLARLRNVRKP
jgi:hypothetical protein